MADNNKTKSLTFTKLQILWTDLMIIAVPVIVIIVKEYPPLYFFAIWGAYWLARLIITAVLHVKKKNRKQKYTFMDAVTPYINHENVDKVAERYLGIEPYRDYDVPKPKPTPERKPTTKKKTTTKK